MHKKLLSFYGPINIWLVYMLVSINVFLTAFFTYDRFFPLINNRCGQSGEPGILTFLPAFITISIILLAVSSICYFLFGVFGFLSTLGSKPDLNKRDHFRQFIHKGYAGFFTALLIAFTLQLILSIPPLTSCPLTLPEIPVGS